MADAATTMAMRLESEEFKGMQLPLIVSVVFHLSLVIFGLVLLPLFTLDPPVIEDTPISVEILDVDDVAKTNEKPVQKPVERPPTNTSEAPPKPVQPTNKAEEPPKPVAPAPPEKIESPTPPAPQDVPDPIAKPEPPKSKPKTPEKPKEPEPKPEPKEDTSEKFKSLLKNLEENDAQEAQNKTEEKAEEQKPLLTRFSEKMTMGELDALKRQLSQCWSIQAGSRYAEELVVTLKLFVNPDRTVRDVKIVDSIRYNTDSFYRAAADSAVRAVYKCSPLDLPPNKPDLWDIITINFDPSEML